MLNLIIAQIQLQLQQIHMVQATGLASQQEQKEMIMQLKYLNNQLESTIDNLVGYSQQTSPYPFKALGQAPHPHQCQCPTNSFDSRNQTHQSVHYPTVLDWVLPRERVIIQKGPDHEVLSLAKEHLENTFKKLDDMLPRIKHGHYTQFNWVKAYRYKEIVIAEDSGYNWFSVTDVDNQNRIPNVTEFDSTPEGCMYHTYNFSISEKEFEWNVNDVDPHLIIEKEPSPIRLSLAPTEVRHTVEKLVNNLPAMDMVDDYADQCVYYYNDFYIHQTRLTNLPNYGNYRTWAVTIRENIPADILAMKDNLGWVNLKELSIQGKDVGRKTPSGDILRKDYLSWNVVDKIVTIKPSQGIVYYLNIDKEQIAETFRTLRSRLKHLTFAEYQYSHTLPEGYVYEGEYIGYIPGMGWIYVSAHPTQTRDTINNNGSIDLCLI